MAKWVLSVLLAALLITLLGWMQSGWPLVPAFCFLPLYLHIISWVKERLLALRCTALHYTTLHYTTLHCTALHCTALHCTTLHRTSLHCESSVLTCFPIYSTVLSCTRLHNTSLYSLQSWFGKKVVSTQIYSWFMVSQPNLQNCCNSNANSKKVFLRPPNVWPPLPYVEVPL